MSSDKTYYEVMGIDPTADEATIKKAYHHLALKCHPDKNPNDPYATANFQNILRAYGTLSNGSQRAAYDEQLRAEQRRREHFFKNSSTYFGQSASRSKSGRQENQRPNTSTNTRPRSESDDGPDSMQSVRLLQERLIQHNEVMKIAESLITREYEHWIETLMNDRQLTQESYERGVNTLAKATKNLEDAFENWKKTFARIKCALANLEYSGILEPGLRFEFLDHSAYRKQAARFARLTDELEGGIKTRYYETEEKAKRNPSEEPSITLRYRMPPALSFNEVFYDNHRRICEGEHKFLRLPGPFAWCMSCAKKLNSGSQCSICDATMCDRCAQGWSLWGPSF
jgi:curved DNA-binding protein CbpA